MLTLIATLTVVPVLYTLISALDWLRIWRVRHEHRKAKRDADRAYQRELRRIRHEDQLFAEARVRAGQKPLR